MGSPTNASKVRPGIRCDFGQCAGKATAIVITRIHGTIDFKVDFCCRAHVQIVRMARASVGGEPVEPEGLPED